MAEMVLTIAEVTVGASLLVLILHVLWNRYSPRARRRRRLQKALQEARETPVRIRKALAKRKGGRGK